MKERTTEQMIKKCYELGEKYGVDSCKKCKQYYKEIYTFCMSEDGNIPELWGKIYGDEEPK